MIKNIIITLLCLLIFPLSILAAPLSSTSSIQMVNSAPSLGDSLTFNVITEKLAGWEYPMVVVSCYQDVNNDLFIDTNMLGPDIVYSWVDHPDAAFLLGAYSSIWTLRGGGDALCRADLDAYGFKGGKEFTRVLDSTEYFVAVG